MRMESKPYTLTAIVSFLALVWMSGVGSEASLWGQTRLPGAQQQDPKTKQPVRPGKKPKLITPEPENVVLETKDRFSLASTYYAPAYIEGEEENGKSAIPFMVMHDWGASREQTFRFALFLQKKGHAVIIPDLRGHGASTSRIGLDKAITYDKMKKTDRSLVILDFEACKKFLVKRNNAGECNIDLLNLVVVGEMSSVAAKWAIDDWTLYPVRGADGVKQAQDVKGIVFIAPRKKFGSFALSKLLKHQLLSSRNGIPLMLVWGELDEVAGKDASSVHKLLEKARPEPDESTPKEELLAARSLFKASIKNSELTGNELISRESVKGLWAYMANTMSAKTRLGESRYPWVNRDKKAAKKR